MATHKIEMIEVIDDDGETLRSVPINEIYNKKLPHRIVHVLIFDKDLRLACQIRSKDKSFCPGCYSTSVGGHVSSGETPKMAAEREMLEEIGKTGELEPMFSSWYEDNDLRKLLYVYRSYVEPPFTLSKREVERIEYLDYDSIDKIPKNKIHPELKFILNLIK